MGLTQSLGSSYPLRYPECLRARRAPVPSPTAHPLNTRCPGSGGNQPILKAKIPNRTIMGGPLIQQQWCYLPLHPNRPWRQTILEFTRDVNAARCKTRSSVRSIPALPWPPGSPSRRTPRVSARAQPLHENVVEASSPPIHAGHDAPRLQFAQEPLAGELRPLVAIEDLRAPPPQRPARPPHSMLTLILLGGTIRYIYFIHFDLRRPMGEDRGR